MLRAKLDWRLVVRAIVVVGVGCIENSSLATQQLARPKLKIILVGDSTVALGGGWGKGFCARLVRNVTCVDVAKNGASTKSFIDQGVWQKALDEKGTLYLIQFGHNDQKPDQTLHTDAKTTYAANLQRFVADVRAIGGEPVLLSPLSRRNYKDGQLVEDGLATYGASARRVAAEGKVRFLDLLAFSRAYLATMTQEQADQFNATTRPDAVAEISNAAKPDRTHLNDAGKILFGGMVAENLIRLEPALVCDFDKKVVVRRQTRSREGNVSIADQQKQLCGQL